MSEKVESGLEVVAWAHPDYCDVITDSPTRTIEWERRGVSQIPLVRQSDAERALQLEMERHRKTWRQLEQVTGLLRDVQRYMDDETTTPAMMARLRVRIENALSQQAEPVCPFCGEPSDHCNQSFPHPSKPAPAQDERKTFEVEIPDISAIYDGRSFIPYRSLEAGERLMTVAQHLRIEKQLRAALTRPAQAEPAPEPREKRARPGYLDQAVIDRVAESSARHLEEISRRLAEPSPAQDERTAFEAWVMQHNTAVREDYDDTDENAPEDIRLDRQGGVYIWANAEAAWFAWKARSALDTRPAQTEQQPEQSGLAEALERVKLTEEEAQHHSVSAVAYWNNAVTACMYAVTATPSHD